MTILEFETREEEGRARITLRGELDLSSVEGLEQELGRVEALGPAELVLDLRELTFLDSTGLRIVVGADQRAREGGRRLVVVKGPTQVHRVFSITKLDERLEMVDDPSLPPPG